MKKVYNVINCRKSGYFVRKMSIIKKETSEKTEDGGRYDDENDAS